MKKRFLIIILVFIVLFVTSCGGNEKLSRELNYALTDGNIAGVQEILSCGKKINLEKLAKKNNGDDAYNENRAIGILFAFNHGRVKDILKELIEKGAETKTWISTDIEELKLFLNNGLDLNDKGENGYSMSDLIIQSLQTEELGENYCKDVINLLVRYDAKITKKTIEAIMDAEDNMEASWKLEYLYRIVKEKHNEKVFPEYFRYVFENDENNLINYINTNNNKIKKLDVYDTPIYLMCSYCSKSVVETLVKNNINLEIKDVAGITPLTVASRYNNHSDVVKYLLNFCKAVTIGAEELKVECMTYALLGGKINNMYVLAKSNKKWRAEILFDDTTTLKTLDYARKLGANITLYDIVNNICVMNEKILIEYEPKLAENDKKLNEALQECLNNGKLERAEQIYSRRKIASVETLDDAITNGNVKLAKAILKDYPEYGYHLTKYYDQSNYECLESAIHLGELELVEMMLKTKKIDVNRICSDEDGYTYTLLHYAAGSTSARMIKLLLKYGADKNIKDSDGKKPIDIAKKLDFENVVEILK